jgi:hypothetical protein
MRRAVLALVEFSYAAHATLRCARQAEPGLIALGTRTGSARDAPDPENRASAWLGSAVALHLVRELVASTRALSIRVAPRSRASARDSSTFRVRIIQRDDQCGHRSPPPHERKPPAYTCDTITPANLLDARLFGSGCITRRAYERAKRKQRKASLGTLVGVRRARRRKTRSTLAQPPNLQAARPGAGCTPNQRADHAIKSNTTPSARMSRRFAGGPGKRRPFPDN